MENAPQKTILIVEDEIIIAMDIQNTLHSLGYKSIFIAESGEEAIAHVSRTPVDLVLMDIGLRGTLDGIETTEQLLSLTPSVRVMFITSYSNLKVRESADKVPHYGYILKPFSTDTLGNAIIRALSAK
jgi:CheY-like chemotaxis protein